MNLKTLYSVGLAALLGVGLSGCGSALSESMSQSFRMSPPPPANVQVNNAAFLVGAGPWKDDCWMYGWGCPPPGAVNFRVSGINPDPNLLPPPVTYQRPTYVRKSRLKKRYYYSGMPTKG